MEKLNYPKSEYLSRLLRKLMTPEEAKLLLALPAETAELAVRFGLDEEAIKGKLHEFMERGLVIPSKGRAEKGWRREIGLEMDVYRA